MNTPLTVLFNTGRFYGPSGQVIAALQTHDYIFMRDFSRGIDYTFNMEASPFAGAVASDKYGLKDLVMRLYDAPYTPGEPRFKDCTIPAHISDTLNTLGADHFQRATENNVGQYGKASVIK